MGSNSGPGGPRSFREKLNFYRFASRWVVPGSSRPVFDLLTELSGYPLWWPEVKQVGVIDEKCARVKIRATLPYSLEFVMRQEVVDKQAGLLQA